MLTAVLPIHVTDHSFWGSSTGVETIKKFLEMVCAIECFDNYIIVAPDERICQLAGKYGMTAMIVGDVNYPERTYTFGESRLIGRKVSQNNCDLNDTLIVLDHRNLMLTARDITKALSLYEKKGGSCVFSLSLLKEYPCQYKAFYSFKGCQIVYLKTSGKKGRTFSHIQQLNCNRKASCSLSEHEEITVCVDVKPTFCSIVFSGPVLRKESVVSHIIPFDEDGPIYKQTRMLHVPPQMYDVPMDFETEGFVGLIFIFASPSRIGEYDTVEYFSSPIAPWRVSEIEGVVTSSKTSEPIIGRQQVQNTYAYDGSIFISSIGDLRRESPTGLLPMHSMECCHVTDWVDYYRFLSR